MTSSVAAIKLVEFGARSMLILLCIYLMPAAEAARFGTVMLFVGFFSFLVGQERYVDLQRRISALSHVDAGAAIISYGRLISVGYLLGIPLLYVLLREFAGVTNQEALLAVMVAVVEHLSQECYRIVMITDRHRVLLFGSAAKTVVVLAVVSVIAIIRGHALSLESVLFWWTAIGCMWILLSAIEIRCLVLSGQGGERIGLRTQCTRSYRHFAIGLVAILALQADRFVAIRVLGVEELAQYFRAVMTAGAAYQILVICSFNRIALDAYRRLRLGEHGVVRMVFRRERAAYLLVMIAVPLTTEAARRFLGISWIEATVPPFAVVALACGSALVRGVADFESIVLNHLHIESRVFISHAIGLCTTVVAASTLGSTFGLRGLLCGSVVGSCAMAASLYFGAQRGLARL